MSMRDPWNRLGAGSDGRFTRYTHIHMYICTYVHFFQEEPQGEGVLNGSGDEKQMAGSD